MRSYRTLRIFVGVLFVVQYKNFQLLNPAKENSSTTLIRRRLRIVNCAKAGKERHVSFRVVYTIEFAMII